MSNKYHFFDHTGDAAVEVYGENLESLYENSIEACTSLLTSLDKIDSHIKKEITLTGSDYDQLLVVLLSELIFLYDVERFLCKNGIITSLTSNKLSATLYGEYLDDAKHEIYTEIKAVTYHKLGIAKTPTGFKTNIIFDL